MYFSETKESFKDELLALGWPLENIDTLNLIDKVCWARNSNSKAFDVRVTGGVILGMMARHT